MQLESKKNHSYHSGIRQRCLPLGTWGLAITLIVAACGLPEQNISSNTGEIEALNVEANTTIETLNISVIPWQDSDRQEAGLQAFARYLEETLDIPVQVELTESYESAVEQLVTGEVEMAALGAFTYIQARDRNPDIEPLVVPITRSTGRPWYTSVIVVREATNASTIDELNGVRFAFVSESSTSGFLVPYFHFQQLDIVPEDYFASVLFSGSHNRSIELLASGEVDAIVTENLNFNREIADGGALATGDYTVIWESEPIPNGPIAISSQLPDRLKIDLLKALIDAPEGLADVSGSESSGYTTIEDGDYDSIRELQQALGL